MEFTKKKITNRDGKPEMIYTQVATGEEKPFPPFQIVASSRGVKLLGESCTVEDMDALQAFAEMISKAWLDHVAMKPKLIVPEGVAT